jgi:uncharacterized protein YciI
MLYAIISQDVEDSLDKRLSVRPAHVERLATLQNEGRLIIAGPHPAIDSEDPGPAGFSGSLIVADFTSQVDAQNWADADPYVEAGVYPQFNWTLLTKVTFMLAIPEQVVAADILMSPLLQMRSKVRICLPDIEWSTTL